MPNSSYSFFNSSTKWLRANFKILLLSCIIAFVTFPKYLLTFSPGIDSPLPWVFNYFADGHMKLGEQILFPHGRLAFLLYPLPIGNNLQLCIAITFFCSALFSFNLFRLFAVQHPKNYLTPVIVLLVMHMVLDIQLMFIGLTFSYALLFHASRRLAHLAAGVFFCVFAIYVKSYCGVICILIIFSECFSILYADKNAKPVLQAIGLYALIFYGFWLGLYRSAEGSLNFLHGQLALASDNSEAVSYYNPHNWRLLSLCIVCLLALPFFAKDKRASHFFWIMFLALFGAWKHAMSRCDTSHLSFFIGFLILLVFSFLLLMKDMRVTAIVLGITAIAAFRLNIPNEIIIQQKEVSLFTPNNLYDLLHNYEFFAKKSEKHSLAMSKTAILPDTILNLIGKSTVDVFPWNYALIPINHLTWQPRPVLHSYAAYTTWLEQQNAEHMNSEHAPEFFIWEINNPFSKIEDIDGRYLLNDAPEMMLQLFSNYDLVFKDKDYLIYKKRAKKFEFRKALVTEPLVLHNDTWMEVPTCDARSVLRLKVHIKKSLTGLIMGQLYKGEAFFIDCEFENGNKKGYRFVPKLATDGLWIYPFVRNPDNEAIEPKIKKIKIMCLDNRMIDNDYSIQFEKVTYKFDTSENTFLNHAFHKFVEIP